MKFKAVRVSTAKKAGDYFEILGLSESNDLETQKIPCCATKIVKPESIRKFELPAATAATMKCLGVGQQTYGFFVNITSGILNYGEYVGLYTYPQLQVNWGKKTNILFQNVFLVSFNTSKPFEVELDEETYEVTYNDEKDHLVSFLSNHVILK